MHLYDCRFQTFIPYATTGQIADILTNRFVQRLDQEPSPSEVKSWRNSLGAFADALMDQPMDDAWIVLEYQLPLASSRIDCMLLGTDASTRKNCVLVELKQWDRCEVTGIPDIVRIGGSDMLHPSAQVRNYRHYLQDAHSAFVEDQIHLSSCAFLHNLKHVDDSGFLDSRYSHVVDDSPLFCTSTVEQLARFVAAPTERGATEELVGAVLSGRYKPSKKLLDHVASSIEGYEPWTLVDEQLVVFNRIVQEISEARESGDKHVIIVTGGPGTGKSVIAVQVVGAAARLGYSVVHATGSKAFTTNLRGIVGSTPLFRYFNSFVKTEANSVDLIVADEAHRLRQTSSSRFAPGSDRPQVGEIMDAAKVSVFLLDRDQSVRANEVGSVPMIVDCAVSKGIDHNLYDLRTQFRCAGSESYVRWVDYVLGLSPNRSMGWKRQEEYDVRIFDDIGQLEAALRAKMLQGYTARMVAGFAWPWSDPREGGALVDDVVIGDWARPWNKKPREMWRRRKGSSAKPENHPYTVWANQDVGFGQVGCIYSAQGFEFDYVGVIFCRDLRWDAVGNRWVADLRENEDPGFKQGLSRNPRVALDKLRHIYRVLCTRGMKGTYLYFLDEATARHFERMAAF